MIIADQRKRALAAAAMLNDSGMPLFTCPVNGDGEPRPPKGYQRFTPDAARLARWRDGRALCGVTGVAYDVIDVDPRNGGKASWSRLVKDLGADGPEVYWTVRTPSQGTHFYIAPLGIGTHPGFLPGIDLKGGLPDGESRGFVFMPPTVRPSKLPSDDGKVRPYTFRTMPRQVNGDGSCDALTEAIGAYEDERRVANGTGASSGNGGRQEVSALRQACIAAERGGQRLALLRYAHEMERKGYDRADIVALLMSVAGEMPVYDPKRPWAERHLRKILHESGAVIGDATDEELEAIEEAGQDVRQQQEGNGSGLVLVRSLATVKRELTNWLLPPYMAKGQLTVTDGEKGQGKSLVVASWGGALTTGLPFPWLDQDQGREPVRMIIFCDEANEATEIEQRFRAAGADMSMVFIPDLSGRRKTGSKPGPGLSLPDGAAIFEKMIRQSRASVAVWDPINDFLSESVQTHNDASVRNALRPIGRICRETGCSGMLIRHLNKDTSAKAKFRGAGTTAYQNRARIHLLAGAIPEEYHQGAQYALAVVDSNLRRVDRKRSLGYDIVDSDVVADDEGFMAPKLAWRGYVAVSADQLSQQPRSHGPEAVVRTAMEKVLVEMFAKQDTWPANEVKAHLAAEGIIPDATQKDAVKKRLGIRSMAGRGKEAGQWFWTVNAERISMRRRG